MRMINEEGRGESGGIGEGNAFSSESCPRRRPVRAAIVGLLPPPFNGKQRIVDSYPKLMILLFLKLKIKKI